MYTIFNNSLCICIAKTQTTTAQLIENFGANLIYSPKYCQDSVAFMQHACLHSVAFMQLTPLRSCNIDF